jgi:hypothetical protein
VELEPEAAERIHAVLEVVIIVLQRARAVEPLRRLDECRGSLRTARRAADRAVGAATREPAWRTTSSLVPLRPHPASVSAGEGAATAGTQDALETVREVASSCRARRISCGVRRAG